LAAASRADHTVLNALLFLFGWGLRLARQDRPCRRCALSEWGSGASLPPDQQGVGPYLLVTNRGEGRVCALLDAVATIASSIIHHIRPLSSSLRSRLFCRCGLSKPIAS